MNSFSWPSEAGRKARVTLALVLAALGAGCATPGAQSIRSDLDGIQQQLWKVQKDSAALADAVKELRVPPPPASPPEPAPGAADIDLRLQAIERDLGALRTRQDEAETRMAGLAQEIRSTREAVQNLIRSAAAGTPATAPAAAGYPAEAQRPESAPGEGTGAAASGEAAAPAYPAILPEDLYRRAYTDFTRGNYDTALQELSEFLQRNPESDLADDAEYLIGEVHYSRQAYPEAVAAFDRVVEDHPESDKAGPAYLKKGLALLEMNRTADAVVQLQHVVSAYPKSEEARIARDRLKGLGLSER